VSVFKKNEAGGFESVENFYSSAATVKQSVRGQEAVSTEFGISVRDYYNNFTDTLTVSLTPWHEVQLDKNNFIAIPNSRKFTVSQWGNGNQNCLWDGIVNVVTAASLFFYDPNTGNIPPYFAVNLGTKVKLSRFRYWSRHDYYFRLYSAKEIWIYGTNDPAVGENPESDHSEWIPLHSEVFVSVRPSGTDVSVPAAGEDYEYGLAGEEWEFPLDAPAVQYVRFLQLSNWTGSTGLHIAELRFWGDPNVQ
jgi:hypothetical protein